MKGKKWLLAMGMVTALSVCFAFSACGGNPENSGEDTHQCAFGTAYEKDETHHWKVCTDETCTKISERGEHAWDNGVLENGVMTYTCSVCSKTKTENKAALYKTTCEKIYTTINGIATPAGGAKAAKTFAVDDSIYTEASAEEYANVKGVNVFVGMLGDLMANDQFVITTKPVAFTYSYEPIKETGSAVLQYVFDETNDKVVMMWNVNSTVNGNTMQMFVYISVDYDFAQSEVKAFTVCNLADPNMLMCYNVYEEGKLWTLKDAAAVQTVLPAVQAYKEQSQSALKDKIDLQADFTAEYSKAMDAMNA